MAELLRSAAVFAAAASSPSAAVAAAASTAADGDDAGVDVHVDGGNDWLAWENDVADH